MHACAADLFAVGTGVLGTLSGGLALDWLGSSVRNALLLCTGELSWKAAGLPAQRRCCVEGRRRKAAQLQTTADDRCYYAQRHPACLSSAGGVAVGCALIMAGFASAQSLAWFGPAFAGGEFGL
jgi:hypothetical protein